MLQRAKECKSDRSRQELSNESLVAFGCKNLLRDSREGALQHLVQWPYLLHYLNLDPEVCIAGECWARWLKPSGRILSRLSGARFAFPCVFGSHMNQRWKVARFCEVPYGTCSRFSTFSEPSKVWDKCLTIYLHLAWTPKSVSPGSLT